VLKHGELYVSLPQNLQSCIPADALFGTFSFILHVFDHILPMKHLQAGLC
jgi:hypothetical protein